MNRYRKVLFIPAGMMVTLVLLSCAGIFPLGAAAIFAVAIPAAYVHMRFGSLAGGSIVLGSAGILGWFVGQGEALVYLLQFGLLSFVLPLFLRRGVAWDRSVALTLSFLLAAGGLVLAALSLAGGLDIVAAVETYLQQELQQVLAMGQKMSFEPEQFTQFETVLRQTVDFFRRTWPAVLVTCSLGLLLATVFGLNRLSRDHYRIAGPPIHLWKLPEMLIWGLIVSGGGVLFGSGVVEFVALNLLLGLLACYFLQGLAIICHYFRKNSVPPILRTLGYVLVVILNPLPVIVAGLGVFDLWVDFRKPRKTNN